MGDCLNIKQKAEETFTEWKMRLILAKLNHEIDLDWSEIVDTLGISCSSDHLRKTAYGIKEVYDYYQSRLQDGITDQEILTKMELQRIELEKTKTKLSDQRREYQNLIRKQGRFDHLIEHFKNEKIDDIKITIRNNSNTNKSKTALLILTDWHTSLKCENYWNNYNLDIFYKRIDELVSRSISYCKFHNVDKVVLLGLGDLINGLIHIGNRVVSEENVIRQLKIVSEVLKEIIKTFAENFNQVDFYSTMGNHARVTPQKDASIDEENFELLIPWYLKAKFENVANVSIYENEYEEEIVVFDIFDKRYFAVHGDKDKMSDVVENLTLMLREFPEAVFMGDKHHLESNEPHGIKVYTCSALSGTDQYAKRIRKTAKAGQELFIFDEEIGLECHYPIKFN